jgi:phosphopentomutase
MGFRRKKGGYLFLAVQLPLDGVVVLDLSKLLPGSLCGQMLADMGAEVIKIEDLQGGDAFRYSNPSYENIGSFFHMLNRNKRSMRLNLSAPAGREIMLQLVDKADVLLETFRPGLMEKLGLGCIQGISGFKATADPLGCFGKMAERSAGKDTTTGHWELAGITLDKPFPVYLDGFPKEVMQRFEEAMGTKTLGNYPSSGTEIIKVLGQQHVMTGYPIVYTSADSVFQIAAHEQVIPIERQYEICRIARGILTGEHSVGRVIARPFTGTDGNFTRTANRRDFSLKPFKKTILDHVKQAGMQVKAVGKIEDIFAGEGITEAVHIHGNMDGVDKTLDFMHKALMDLFLPI